MKAPRVEIYVQPTSAPWHPRTNQLVDRQSGCDVMAIFENVKNIRYRYQRLRLQLINLNYGSIYIRLSYLLTAHRSFPQSLLLRRYNETNNHDYF